MNARQEFWPTGQMGNKLIDYEKMQQYLKEARVVITHGGPASFMAPLSMGKIPIVIPRQKQFEEHVNDHQVDFVKQVTDRYNNIIPVYNISELKDKIINYDDIVENLRGNYSSNNKEFVKQLDIEIKELFEK